MFSSSPPPLVAAPDPVPRLLRDLVHERTGIYFESDRLDTLLEKLASRVQAHGCDSYLDYYYILKYEEKGPDEWRRVMDTFSVAETYFWREFDQVRALVDRIVPAWFRQHPDTPLRIWSAACATGEEPYTLVLALREAGWQHHPIQVFGSDASEAALEKARAGLYRERSFRALPADLRLKYFRPVDGAHQLAPEIMRGVQFQRANLVDGREIAGLASADVTFCRNVFIYFSPAAISRVVGLFAQHSAPGSHLFVGAAESLVKLTTAYDLEELGSAFVYRRRAQP